MKDSEKVLQIVFTGVTRKIRIDEFSVELSIQVDIHKGSVHSPLLFDNYLGCNSSNPAAHENFCIPTT